jgi:hypothetical protein
MYMVRSIRCGTRFHFECSVIDSKPIIIVLVEFVLIAQLYWLTIVLTIVTRGLGNRAASLAFSDILLLRLSTCVGARPMLS